MTNTAPDNSIDPTANQQIDEPDELEDWLTDLRINLNDDPPDWLAPEGDHADPTPGRVAVLTAYRSVPDSASPAHSTRPAGNLQGDRPAPAGSRHRAPE